MRGSKAIRTAAWSLVVAGTVAPLLRKRMSVPPLAMQTLAFAGPVGLCVAVRRSRRRDVAVCALQMWAYLAAYKSPHDDAQGQGERVLVDYPIAIDRILGLGELPTVRLQRRLARGQWRLGDKVLVWAHWVWFMVPHGALVYLMLRHPRRFERSAVITYAVFDIGAMVYWVLPTAPPWYAAGQAGRDEEFDGELLERAGTYAGPVSGGGRPNDATEGGVRPREEIAVRRMMVEYGQFFWKDGWGPLYSVLGGNPLAAMPSLHFATSMTAARLLADASPVAGAVGWTYTGTLGFALVYLGEHYVIDLLAGAALAQAVRGSAPRLAPAFSGLGRAVAAIEARAHG
ncbi:MAG TPA: phosphatase PAP2 family protein [Solirubrobacteraceae bacterium]|nr:phosphatase PAP2 family protein [Solirubrobacteraceae bacterium]